MCLEIFDIFRFSFFFIFINFVFLHVYQKCYRNASILLLFFTMLEQCLYDSTFCSVQQIRGDKILLLNFYEEICSTMPILF